MTNKNSFDPIWEEIYQQGHAQYYPWDHVVSFIYSYSPKNKPRDQVKILEIGCGTASNLWFVAREKFQAYGLDASQSAITFAKKRFKQESLSVDLKVGDFTKLPYEDNSFDMVIDRAAITCCGFSAAKKVISEVNRVLKKQGHFLFNPYSKTHSSYSSSEDEEDGLVKNISKGTLQNTGQICMYDQDDIEEIFCHGWSFRNMQHLQLVEELNEDKLIHAEWRVVLEKI